MRPISRGTTIPSRPSSRQRGDHSGAGNGKHGYNSFMSVNGNTQNSNTSRMNENPNMYTARQNSRGGNRHGNGGNNASMFNGQGGGQIHHSHHNQFKGSSSGIPAATPRVGVDNNMIVRAPVSPLGFDLAEVPCWNSNVSMPAENLQSSTSHQQRSDVHKHSFLPGLLNSKHLKNHIRSSSTVGNDSSNPSTARLKHPVYHQKNPNGQSVRGIGEIKNIPSYPGNGNGSLPQQGRGGNAQGGKKSLFQTDQKTYQVEGGPGHQGMHGGHDIYDRNISTAAPALASASRYGGNNGRYQDSDRGDGQQAAARNSGEIPVEPWAYRIIEKYNSSGSRPVSRTSSRISRAEMMQINNQQKGGNVEAVREDLLRVKSLGRFTKS